MNPDDLDHRPAVDIFHSFCESFSKHQPKIVQSVERKAKSDLFIKP